MSILAKASVKNMVLWILFRGFYILKKPFVSFLVSDFTEAKKEDITDLNSFSELAVALKFLSVKTLKYGLGQSVRTTEYTGILMFDKRSGSQSGRNGPVGCYR